MGWANCGTNTTFGVEMGYANDGICMEGGCGAEIDHGLSYVCGGMHEGGKFGCGGYFCEDHLIYGGPERLCAQCTKLYECLGCGCNLVEHFEPDWGDPGTEDAYCAGRLNHCGDCGECYGSEYPERV